MSSPISGNQSPLPIAKNNDSSAPLTKLDSKVNAASIAQIKKLSESTSSSSSKPTVADRNIQQLPNQGVGRKLLQNRLADTQPLTSLAGLRTTLQLSDDQAPLNLADTQPISSLAGLRTTLQLSDDKAPLNLADTQPISSLAGLRTTLQLSGDQAPLNLADTQPISSLAGLRTTQQLSAQRRPPEPKPSFFQRFLNLFRGLSP